MFDKINEELGDTFRALFGGGKARLELEDENGVLSEFEIADGGGYTFEKDGNTLRVTVDDPATARIPMTRK